MSQPLAEWTAETRSGIAALPEREITETLLFRDPLRGRAVDPSAFLAPADGVVLYTEEVGAGAAASDRVSTLEVKGRRFALEDVLEYDPGVPCLAIGIFMTYYDVHVNRLPTDGIVTGRELAPLLTDNAPMVLEEDELLRGLLGARHPRYERYNARVVNRVHAPRPGYSYWLVQIADDEVDTIAPFSRLPGRFYRQGQRFSSVRWGSQVDLVLPLPGVRPTVKAGVHVTGGVDRVAEFA